VYTAVVVCNTDFILNKPARKSQIEHFSVVCIHFAVFCAMTEHSLAGGKQSFEGKSRLHFFSEGEREFNWITQY